jgi:type I restriction enzyme R subunit
MLTAQHREAERSGDEAGAKRLAHELEEAGTTRDALDLFKKNLASFVRTYEFLSQIVHFEDRELEQLCVFAKHLQPLLRADAPDDEELDLSELQLTHYRLTKRAEHQLQIAEGEGEYGLKPVSEVGSGKPHDPEKQRLSEIIERLNELFGAEVSDNDKLHYANGIADRIERDEAVMEQVRSHSPDQVMHGLFPKRVTDIVLDAMQDHEKLSMEVLENEGTSREFALLILRLLADRQPSQQPSQQPSAQR